MYQSSVLYRSPRNSHHSPFICVRHHTLWARHCVGATQPMPCLCQALPKLKSLNLNWNAASALRSVGCLIMPFLPPSRAAVFLPIPLCYMSVRVGPHVFTSHVIKNVLCQKFVIIEDNRTKKKLHLITYKNPTICPPLNTQHPPSTPVPIFGGIKILRTVRKVESWANDGWKMPNQVWLKNGKSRNALGRGAPNRMLNVVVVVEQYSRCFIKFRTENV
jgi:hypothetical protein